MKQRPLKLTSLFLSLFLLATLVGSNFVTAFAADIQPEDSSSISLPTVSSVAPEDASESAVPTPEAQPEASSSSIAPPDSSSLPTSSQAPQAGSSSLPASSQTEVDVTEVPIASVSLEALLAAARTDGAGAALLLNAVEDDAEFIAALKQVLDMYYSEENLDTQLAAFSSAVDARAAETLASYAAAAIQRTSAEEQGFVPGEVLVVFETDLAAAQQANIANSLDGNITQSIETPEEQAVAVAEISLEQTVEEAVEEYTADPNIAYAQPNYLYTALEDTPAEADIAPNNAPFVEDVLQGAKESTNDPLAKDQWYLDQVNIVSAWNNTSALSSRSRVKVAVIDSTVQTNHPDLTHNINHSESVDFSTGTATSLNSPMVDHGTHVAGIVAAKAGNSLGIAGVAGLPSGVSPVEILAINVFNRAGGEKSASSSNIIAAINYSVAKGARVINLSLGHRGWGYSDTLTEQTINNATASGTLVVAAAGNDPDEVPTYPSDFANTLSVIALDKNNNRAYFSSYGAKKNVAAPGVSIASTVRNNKYAYLQGTSMASPVVAGIAGLMFYANPNLTATQARDILQNTASNAGSGFNNYTGWGLVDAGKAIESASDTRTVSISPASASVIVGQQLQLNTSITPVTSNRTVFWASSNPAVASVNRDTGVVSTHALGSAVITATLTNSNQATCTITVVSPVTSLRFAQKQVTLAKGQKLFVKPTVYTSVSYKSALKWKSNKTSVVTVASNGTLTARRPGSATITVTSDNGKTARLVVKVLAKKVFVTKVTATGMPKTLALGKTKYIGARITPANATGVKVSFKSSNAKVLHVDAAGKLTAKKTGTAKITIAAGGKKATYTVRVSGPAATKVTLNKTKATLRRKGSLRLKATVAPANADKTITWSTNNKKVATVTSGGLVKAKGKGTCYITAKTVSGKKIRCRITVK